MMNFLIVLSFFVSVECYTCEIGNLSGVFVPVFSLYIIGFLMLLMLTAIIFLIYLLHRNKSEDTKYNLFPENKQQPVVTNSEINRSYKTPQSCELTIMDPSITKLQECHKEKMIKNETSSNVTDSKITTIDKQNGLGKNFKVYRSVKKPANQQLILKEQMKKICEDTLAKSHINGMTASLQDLNKLLNEKTSGSKGKVTAKQEFDVYDTNPSNIPVDELVEEAVYECVPSGLKNHTIVEDNDTKYLLTISKENLVDDEEDSIYMNARYRYNMPTNREIASTSTLQKTDNELL